MKIVILYLATGNINSVKNVLKKIFNGIIITSNLNVIKDASVIFVAGVSSFDSLILELKKKNLFDFLKNEKKIKIIGICSGMQIMFESSEEGKEKGLNIFKERLRKFDEKLALVPHVGWNKIVCKYTKLTNQEFYFCHSYYAPVNLKFTYAKTFYSEEFSSIVKKDNFFGIQFHPEKSNLNGQKLIKYIVNE